jgi:hypothetical protein
MGATYTVLPSGCATPDVHGQTYYLCGNTWFQPAYGANGVHYRGRTRSVTKHHPNVAAGFGTRIFLKEKKSYASAPGKEEKRLTPEKRITQILRHD